MSVCPIGLAIVLVACGTPEGRQSGPLNSVSAVLERYQQALGGADAIRRVQSEVVYGEIETSLKPGAKSKFVYYARPSKMLMKVARPDGREVVSGFDGYTSWAVAPEGASVDREVALDSMRRDADLQFPLHEQDYFKKLEFAGIADFNGGSATGCAEPPRGARKAISTTTSRRDFWPGTASSQPGQVTKPRPKCLATTRALTDSPSP
jgi:hypothetical protein